MPNDHRKSVHDHRRSGRGAGEVALSLFQRGDGHHRRVLMREPSYSGAELDPRSLARAVDRHLRRPALRSRRATVLHGRTGLRGVRRHGCRRSAALRTAARLQPDQRRLLDERPDTFRRLRAGRPGPGAGGCRTRRRRETRRRFARSRPVRQRRPYPAKSALRPPGALSVGGRCSAGFVSNARRVCGGAMVLTGCRRMVRSFSGAALRGSLR